MIHKATTVAVLDNSVSKSSFEAKKVAISEKLPNTAIMTENCNLYRRISFFLLILANISYAISFSFSKLKIGEYGLIHSFSPLFFISITLLTISFLLVINKNSKDKTLLFIHLILLILFFSIIPILIEGTPRFPYNFHTLYNIEYIILHGHSNFEIEKYQSWPGVFYFGAILIQITGLHLIDFLILIPFILKLMNIPYTYLLYSTLLENEKEIWAAFLIGEILFFAGPSYILPGVLGMTISAYAILIFIRYEMIQKRNSSSIRCIFIIFSITSIISHLLSSIFLFLGMLVLTSINFINRRRYSSISISFLLLTIIILWQFFVIESYSLSILKTFLDQFLKLELVYSGATRMAFSGTVEHTNVVYIRIFSALIISMLALIGFLYHIYSEKTLKYKDVLLLSLIMASSVPAFLTPYSGEIVSRVFSANNVFLNMFASKNINNKFLSIIFIIIVFISPVLSLINAYGNEYIDYISPVELKGSEFLFNYSPNNSVIESFQKRMWISRYSENLKWSFIEDTNIIEVRSKHIYVLIGERDSNGYSFVKGIIDSKIRSLVGSYDQIYDNCDFDLYTLRD